MELRCFRRGLLVAAFALAGLLIAAGVEGQSFFPSSPTPFYPPVPPARPPYQPAPPQAPPGTVQPAPSVPNTARREQGILNPKTGEFYPGTYGGVIDPKTGVMLPKVDGGYVDPRTGEVIPRRE